MQNNETNTASLSETNGIAAVLPHPVWELGTKASNFSY